MPIYAYRCDSCGHTADVLQKMSAPALTECPACGASTFSKQLTAPAFQLKGTGWYVTDFRDNGKKPPGKPDGEAAAAGAKAGESPATPAAPAPAASGGSATASASAAPAAPAASPAPAATPSPTK